MAEVHILGNIKSAEKFPQQNLFCLWSFNYGSNWKIVSGKTEGRTFCSFSEENEICEWNFPLDIHFATSGIVGWPKLYLQIYHIDWLKRSHLFGYGYLNVPTSPGPHSLNCYTWRPLGTLKERITQFFLGGAPELKSADLLLSLHDRYKLNTESMGIVTVELTLITRNFHKFGIEYN